MLLRIEKRFTSAAGWSATFAYIYSHAETAHRTWNHPIFDFNFGKPGQGGFQPSTLVDEHRLVYSPTFCQLDLRLSKQAFGCGDNLNLDRPNSTRGDPRTFRLAVIYRF